MSYSATKLTGWDRATLADGNLFAAEFDQIYDNIENSIIGNSAAAPTFTMKQLYEALCPIGSVIAFLPGYFTDGSNGGWTYVSAVGTLTDYFKICDGSALSAVASPLLGGTGRYLPNISDDRFLMGSTAYGNIGGSSTMTHTHSTPAHYHGMGTGATLNITASGAHTHTTNITSSQVGFTYNTPSLLWPTGVSSVVVQEYSSSSDTHTHAASSFSGVIGLVTGGVNGNAAMTSGAASNSENRPLYLSCRYIMRVK